MSTDPRTALAALTAAFERHLEAASTRRGDNDPTVVAAYQDLADAFDTYDEALEDAYNEVTPLGIYTEDEELDDAEDGPYVGLDDEEYDDVDSDDDDDDDDDDSDDDDDDDDDDLDDSEDDDDDDDSDDDVERTR